MKYESEDAELRIKALAESIGEYPEDITDEGDNRFSVGRREWMVLTDKEADEEAQQDIEQTLWGFNADFLCSHMDLPWEAQEMIASFCNEKCEDANDTIYALLDRSEGGIEGFIEAAISADGRGHFINSYDGNEDEVEVEDEDGNKETYYIYRMN